MSFEFDELLERRAPFNLYVGPELSQAAGLPDRGELLEGLLARAEDILPEHQRAELRDVAEDRNEPRHAVFAALERDLSPPTYGKAIERMLDDRGRPVPPLARALAQLDGRVHGVLTSNLDHLLERAFAGTLDVHARPLADLGTRSGWLFKFQGTLRDRSTWKFTSEQRRHALHRDPLHKQLFDALFLTQTVVFVATPVDDPVFLEIVEAIAGVARGQPPQHYMFVEARAVKPRHRKRLAEAGISLITHGGPEELLNMLAQLAGVDETPAPSRPPPSQSSAKAARNPARGRKLSLSSARDTLAVLFAAANPRGTDPLRVQQEERNLREAIAMSPNRDRLDLETRPAVTFTDLHRALLHRAYDVVHLSGHAETEGLILEDAHGDCVQIPPRGLAMLFANFTPPEGRLRCVVLNSCFSLSSGAPISTTVDYTVAMDGAISDRAALEFTRGFYDALGAGFEVPRAFREGMTRVAATAPGARFDARLLEDEGEADPEDDASS